MTRFFIPGFEDDAAEAERVYAEIRAAVEERLGEVPHERRIGHILCRRHGIDSAIDVGEAVEGRTVVAILQLGRTTFTIHCEGPGAGGTESTIELDHHSVYEVADFES